MAVGSLSSSTTSNIYGSKSRNGIGGLASGLDTDELIAGMTSGTKGKINKQLQSKQSLQWQMDAYRSVSSKLIEYSQKYISLGSPSSLYRDSFFDRNIVTAVGSNSKYVKATGTSSGIDSLAILGVKNLARNAEFITNKSASNQSIISQGNIDFSADEHYNELAGKTMSFKYGGKNYSIAIDSDLSPDATMQDIVDSLNGSLEDVEITGGNTLDEKMEFKYVPDASDPTNTSKGSIEVGYVDPADGNSLEISGGSAGLLTSMGLAEGSITTGGKVTGAVIDATTLKKTITFTDRIQEANLSFSYNGVTKTIQMPTKAVMDGWTSSGLDEETELAKHMQKELDNAFGSKRIKVDIANGGTGAGKLSFTTVKPDTRPGALPGATRPDESSVLKLNSGDPGMLGDSGAFKIDYGSSNRLDRNKAFSKSNFSGTPPTLVDKMKPDGTPEFEKDGVTRVQGYKMTINGEDIYFNKDATINDMVDQINGDSRLKVKVTYLETSDKFSIEATDQGASGSVNVSGDLAECLFGVEGSGPDDYQIKQGEDAVIAVSYGGKESTITRSSNTFDLDGLSVTVSGKFGYDSTGALDPTQEKVTFDAKANVDNIVKAVKEMVDAYNEIIKISNTEVSTKKNRDYQPLTEEQKEGMTEKQIETWEEKAKAGMLFNDSSLRGFTDEIRFIFSSSTENIALLKDIGLTTSTTRTDNGKVVLDENALKAALEQRPDDVKKLFCDPMKKVLNPSTGKMESDPTSGGLMAKIKNTFDKYASTEGYVKGIFVEKAGTPYSVSSILSNSIQKEMDDIDDIVESLKDRLEMEEDRYYRQFTNLEKVIGQMNSQSSWLSQQFGQ